MPGMAANPKIFEYIKLPEDQFKIHWLEWIIPEHNESLIRTMLNECMSKYYSTKMLFYLVFHLEVFWFRK